MTADKIRKHLEDAGLDVDVSKALVVRGEMRGEISASGKGWAWQDALGPTRKQVEEACQDAFAHMTFAGRNAWTGLDPEDGLEFIADLVRRLYP